MREALAPVTLALELSQPDKPSGTSPDEGGKTVIGGPLIDPELRAALARELVETSTRGHILVVDTDPTHAVARLLEDAGFSVKRTDDGVLATQLLASRGFDAAITDLGARELSGMDLLRFVRVEDPDLPVLLMTAAPDVESAAQAVEHGAFQYLLKPVPNDRLVHAVERAVRARRTAREKSDIFDSMMVDHATVETERAEDRKRWGEAMGRLWMAYQPIVLPAGRLYAYEALVRSDEPSLRGAGELLDMAEQVGGLRELGRLIRRLAGAFAVRANGAHYTFVNLHADDLLDELLTAPAEPLSQIAPAVVLEITERAALHDVEEAKVKMRELRSIGYRIALDDLGAGYAGLTAFAQLRPDVVKLDMALVQGIDRDPVKRKIVASVTQISRDMGITVVGEGVETQAERDVIVELGCHLLQGYLFGRPTRI